MPKYVDYDDKIVVTTTTDFDTLTPSGRSSYNVHGNFFNYISATSYSEITDVVLGNSDPRVINTWQINVSDDMWVKGFILILERRSSAPSSPATKDSYYNTTNQTSYYYNGTDWISFEPSTFFDTSKINYNISNHLRKVNARDIVLKVEDQIPDKTEIGTDCCNEYLDKYIILYSCYLQAQVKFDIGSHVRGLERINYIHDNQ